MDRGAAQAQPRSRIVARMMSRLRALASNATDATAFRGRRSRARGASALASRLCAGTAPTWLARTSFGLRLGALGAGRVAAKLRRGTKRASLRRLASSVALATCGLLPRGVPSRHSIGPRLPCLRAVFAFVLTLLLRKLLAPGSRGGSARRRSSFLAKTPPSLSRLLARLLSPFRFGVSWGTFLCRRLRFGVILRPGRRAMPLVFSMRRVRVRPLRLGVCVWVTGLPCQPMWPVRFGVILALRLRALCMPVRFGVILVLRLRALRLPVRFGVILALRPRALCMAVIQRGRPWPRLCLRAVFFGRVWLPLRRPWPVVCINS